MMYFSSSTSFPCQNPFMSAVKTIIVTALWLLIQDCSASPVTISQRVHGSCKGYSVSVKATADSAIYDLPAVDDDIGVGAWTIHTDTWSTPTGYNSIIRNTTTSGTYNIYGQLCVPTAWQKKDILQIATHGIHYDSRYWDPEVNRESQSYVEAALEAGYSIFTYDRLGTGQSDHPDAYTVVQAPLQLEILRQLTLMARNGSLYSLAGKAQPPASTFNGLNPPSKVIHVGHSFGSFLTSAFIGKYSNLTDGAIITGYILDQYTGKGGVASFSSEFAATASPPFNRGSGYVVSRSNGIQNIFFGGNLKTAYTKAMFNYGNAIKQPIAVGEIASACTIIGQTAPNLKAPVQYMLAEFDFYICGGDCKGGYNVEYLKNSTYPNVAEFEIVIQPNTGHGFTLHNNASAGYQVSLGFLARNGL
jgi:pimeloyl-ACP methyl ester carboxylesterase